MSYPEERLPSTVAASASSAYGFYVLSLLCAANAFNFGDRILIGVLQESLRADFKLSDFEMGLLGGPAFALLYTFMGFPIARLAERHDRANIISAAIAMWSAMTFFCGMATSYVQLFLARVGVSVGEAGCAPPAHSLISDYFPQERRAGAMAVYAVGAPLGALTMSLTGGMLAQAYGWRTAFTVFGAAGIALAILVRLGLREPRRIAGPPAERSSFLETVRVLTGKSSFRRVCYGSALAGFSGYFILQYLVSFLMRTQGLALSRAALVAGITAGVCAAVGTAFSGWLTNRLVLRNARAPLLVSAGGLAMAAVLYLVAFLTPYVAVVVPALALAAFFQNFFMGQSYAVVQDVAPDSMRATASALFIFANSLIGFGLGPPVFGALSDLIARLLLPPDFDAALCASSRSNATCVAAEAGGLQWAMIIAALTIFLSAYQYWRARRSYVEERMA